MGWGEIYKSKIVTPEEAVKSCVQVDLMGQVVSESVGYIVTEYGIADLKGKTLKDRGRGLIRIAHPNFRAQLIEEWERRNHTKF